MPLEQAEQVIGEAGLRGLLTPLVEFVRSDGLL